MKVNAGLQAYQATRPQATDAARQRKVEILKKALESHEETSAKLDKMIEPKGRLIDVRY